MNLEEAKQLVHKSGIRLMESGLIAGTWGNISVRVDDKTMVITPSGIGYDKATPEDEVVVNIEDYSYDKSGPKPSTEKKIHAEIYKSRPEINAIIHVHSMNASVVAAARREIPPILDDMAQILGPTVRCADYAIPGTKSLVKNTLKALKGRNAVLMANHGALCLGRDMDEAFTCCMVLEKSCKVFIEAEFLGGAKEISKFDAVVMHQFYLKKYSKMDKKKKK